MTQSAVSNSLREWQQESCLAGANPLLLQTFVALQTSFKHCKVGSTYASAKQIPARRLPLCFNLCCCTPKPITDCLEPHTSTISAALGGWNGVLLFFLNDLPMPSLQVQTCLNLDVNIRMGRSQCSRLGDASRRTPEGW